MKRPRVNVAVNGGIQFNYLSFGSVRDFNRFVDSEFEYFNYSNKKMWDLIVLSAKLKVMEGSEWYGQPVPNKMQDLEFHQHYLGMRLVEELRPKIRNYLSKFLDHQAAHDMPIPKVSYNSKGLGLFSFDRAALGLYKMPRIDTRSNLETISSQLRIELKKTEISTKVKDSYAFFKNKAVSIPSIKIYVMCGANGGVDGNDLLYVGLACGELVEFLEKRNVPVEVNALIGTQFEGNVNMAIVRIKSFENRLDKNQLLLITSDPRYYRFRGFKALIAISNRFGLTIPKGLGSIEYKMGSDFLNAINEESFIFEQSYSLEAAAREVKSILKRYNKSQVNNEKENSPEGNSTDYESGDPD